MLLGIKKVINGLHKGIINLFNKTNSTTLEFWFFAACIIGLLLSLYPSLAIIRDQQIYTRYLLPGLPFFAIILGKGFIEAKKRWQVIIAMSLLILCIYSFAMTSTSAIFYYNIQQENKPLYDYINANPEVTPMVSMLNTRALRYYTGRETLELLPGQLTIEGIRNKTHIFGQLFIPISCYNEEMPKDLPELSDPNKAQLIFSRGGTKLYKIP